MPPKGFSKLSPDQRADAVRRFAAGERAGAVGRSFGVSGSAVLRFAKEAGVETAPQPPTDLARLIARFRAGEKVAALAQEVGETERRLCYYFRKAGVPPMARSERGRRSARTVPNLVDIVRRYEAGATLGDLAPLAGFRTWQALRRHLAGSGVSIRRSPIARTEIDTDELVRRYGAGESLSALSRSVGLCVNSVRYRLVRRGVALRPESAARQTGLTFAAPVEGDLVAELHQWGFACTPQKAVANFNIDVAFDEVRVAVEIENGPSFAPAHRERLMRRTAYLLGAGWCVLFVVSHKYITYWGEVLDQLIPLLDRAAAGAPVFGKYGAINHLGQRRDRPRYTLGALPRLDGL